MKKLTITISGEAGAGKTTLLAFIQKQLGNVGVPIVNMLTDKQVEEGKHALMHFHNTEVRLEEVRTNRKPKPHQLTAKDLFDINTNSQKNGTDVEKYLVQAFLAATGDIEQELIEAHGDIYAKFLLQ